MAKVKRKKTNRVAATVVPAGMKRCPTCTIEFPATREHFSPDVRHRDGFCSRCRNCQAAGARARYRANPEQGRATWRARYADPVKGEQIRAAVRERYAANPEPAKAAMRARKVDLKSQGLCINCTAPAVAGKVYCAGCALKGAERRLVRKYALDFAARAAILRERNPRT